MTQEPKRGTGKDLGGTNHEARRANDRLTTDLRGENLAV